jgi:hypothetical protein
MRALFSKARRSPRCLHRIFASTRRLLGSHLRSVRNLPSHTSNVHGVRHLLFKQARGDVLRWTVARGGAQRARAASV